MIRNIIFDMGNVLLDFNPRNVVDLFFENEEDKQLILKELFHGPEWIAGDYGTITNEERYNLVKARIPSRLHERFYHCVNEWFCTMIPIPGAREFLNSMKEKGYGIYVLSNACNGFYEYFPKFCPLDFFDGIVVSSDVHMLKPDFKIYEYIAAKYQLNPEECLFIDDREENVDAAVRFGMKGYKFKGVYRSAVLSELYKITTMK